MSGREKGTGKCADILDHIYKNKKLTIFGPFALAGVVLLLFVLFGQNADKWLMVRDSLILAVIMYVGVLFAQCGLALGAPSSHPGSQLGGLLGCFILLYRQHVLPYLKCFGIWNTCALKLPD